MTSIEVPATCIPDLSVSFDVNKDWPCKRAQFISSLNLFASDIETTERRLAARRDPRVRKNLEAWIADASARYAKLLTFLDEKVCTCRESGLYN